MPLPNAEGITESDKSTQLLLANYYKFGPPLKPRFIVQELCESRGGRPELSVLTSLLVSVDVKLY